jgi:DNA-binding protein YbaB
MLQDLITAAVNEALRVADEMMNAEMGKLTGGMNLGF